MTELGPAVYLDTSALVKLIRQEAGSSGVSSLLETTGAVPASSQIAEVELMRAVRRHSPELSDQARSLLDEIVLLPLTAEIRTRAQFISPTSIRSLDAIHMATGLGISPHLAYFVTYDRRMAEAAETTGLPAMSPADPA